MPHVPRMFKSQTSQKNRRERRYNNRLKGFTILGPRPGVVRLQKVFMLLYIQGLLFYWGVIV